MSVGCHSVNGTGIDQTRMHCLHITLPREQGFDEFDPASYAEALTDFRAVLAGDENPQGYED